MNLRLTPDEQAMLMLCSSLGLPERGPGALAPCTLAEWNKLARKLQSSLLERPGALLGLGTGEIERLLGLAGSEAERLSRLVDRGGLLAIELERLANRGMWVITRASEAYPRRLRDKLREAAPTVLFGSGDLSLCLREALAIVGSRDVGATGQSFTEGVSRWTARSRLAVISGAARGVDRIAMQSALEAGGVVIGVLADSLERAIRPPDSRVAIADGRLLLLTPYHPSASFSVGAAMGRNKIVYGLATWALVVAATVEKGGTWAGAIETLKAGWTTLFVRTGEGTPEGNRALRQKGASPFPSELDEESGDLAAWLRDAAEQASSQGRRSVEELGTYQPNLPSPPSQGKRVREEAAKGAVSAGLLVESAMARESDTGSTISSEEPAVSVSPAARSVGPDWPGIEGFLEEPRSVRQVAEHFGKTEVQARSRLQRLLKAGRVCELKLSRPCRYQLASRVSRLDL